MKEPASLRLLLGRAQWMLVAVASCPLKIPQHGQSQPLSKLTFLDDWPDAIYACLENPSLDCFLVQWSIALHLCNV